MSSESTKPEVVAASSRAIPQNSAQRFAHIDALRAFAVMLVIVQHAGISQVPGDSGVTVFFGISGFIITFVLLRERDRSGGFNARRFYARRLLKLGPPFLVAILIPTLIWAIFNPVSWKAVLSQIFFSYNWVQIFDNPASEMVMPGTNVVWSLGVEEQFYIAFSIIWLFLVRAAWWRAGLVVLASVAIVYSNVLRLVLWAEGDRIEHLLRGTDARMDAIAWGVLAAVAYHAHSQGRLPWLSRFGSDAVLVVAAVAFVLPFAVQGYGIEQVVRNLVHPLAAVSVILYGLMPSGSRLQGAFYRLATLSIVQLLGLASYSIYIAHYVIVEPIYYATGDISNLIRVPALTVIGVLAGIVVYQLVEKPVLAYRNRKGW